MNLTHILAILGIPVLLCWLGARLAELWAARRWVRAWLTWRLDRPVLATFDRYPRFIDALAAWSAMRPARRDFQR